MANGIKVLDMNRFQLCGVDGCCPEVEINAKLGSMKITDDYGGTVTLTNEQAKLFKVLITEQFPD